MLHITCCKWLKHVHTYVNVNVYTHVYMHYERHICKSFYMQYQHAKIPRGWARQATWQIIVIFLIFFLLISRDEAFHCMLNINQQVFEIKCVVDSNSVTKTYLLRLFLLHLLVWCFRNWLEMLFDWNNSQQLPLWSLEHLLL